MFTYCYEYRDRNIIQTAILNQEGAEFFLGGCVHKYVHGYVHVHGLCPDPNTCQCKTASFHNQPAEFTTKFNLLCKDKSSQHSLYV